MKIGNSNYHTIWLNDKQMSVQIIAQQLLPFKFEIRELKTVDEICIAIKDMWVRGAPLIGVTAAFGMYIAALEAEEDNFVQNIEKSAKLLRETRPTAVNLNFAIDNALEIVKETKSRQEAITASLQYAEALKESEILACENIGNYGLKIIEEIAAKKNGETVNILTHCNAGWLACIDYGTATAPIYFAHDKGIKIHVWVDETRPRNQGARLTAFELEQHGVACTLIADNTGGHLMQHGMVDMAIVGTDRTTVTGDVANKIGTYLKALAAFDNDVPFYVAAPSSSIDWTIEDGIKEIPIEQRDAYEVKYMEGIVNNKVETVLITSETVDAANYGFDVTPARLVTGLITERGICKANKRDILSMFPEKEKTN